MNNGWIVYNHALIPDCDPHEEPDLSVLNDKNVWKQAGGVLFMKWTTDFDCIGPTSYYACICDKPLGDIASMKYQLRRWMKKAQANFYSRPITENELESVYATYVESLKGYEDHPVPEEKGDFVNGWSKAMKQEGAVLIGAYRKEDDVMCGFAHCIDHGKYIPISSFKSNPEEEKKGVNFALMLGIFDYYKENLKNGSYLFDGWRNILHRTAFQDWLEKYFGFRKAYCRLHVRYSPKMRIAVRLAYPLKGLLRKMDKIGFVHKVNGVLLLEEMVRADKKAVKEAA